ncbi:MAG: dienelactone hydrolase family protein [Holosporaceae bacterium]|jgi:phospholipase/carboxylesterase|nr:dienelactone hydrolase family protein [Holosporaceae bacterium]
MIQTNEIILKSKEKFQKLLFVFHGYGADGNNLLPVGEEFAQATPSAEICIPNGLEVCEAGFGYQWFPLIGDDLEVWGKSFDECSDRIISYIESKMQEKHVGYEDVIFTGFSQGAMLSLGLGLKCGVQAIIAFSGGLLSPKPIIASKRTKVLLAHGVQDVVVDVSFMRATENMLKAENVNVQTAVSANAGHGIDDYMLCRAVDFLKSL